jgi:hypothetical protein
MSTNTTIHAGFWTNWSKGPITGSTLTLSSRNGNILIAVLALFISLSGGQSWSILSLLTHEVCTTKAAKDGAWHQQQACCATAARMSTHYGSCRRLAGRGRRQSIRSVRRSLSLILLGLLHLALFFVAGIFSSHIVSVDNQVLLASSPFCGPFPLEKSPTSPPLERSLHLMHT